MTEQLPEEPCNHRICGYGGPPSEKHHPDCPRFVARSSVRYHLGIPWPAGTLCTNSRCWCWAEDRAKREAAELRTSKPCAHDLPARETACADGMCPLCLAAELDEAERQRDAWQAEHRGEVAVYARLAVAERLLERLFNRVCFCFPDWVRADEELSTPIRALLAGSTADRADVRDPRAWITESNGVGWYRVQYADGSITECRSLPEAQQCLADYLKRCTDNG
jgi:hypothetical protein